MYSLLVWIYSATLRVLQMPYAQYYLTREARCTLRATMHPVDSTADVMASPSVSATPMYGCDGRGVKFTAAIGSDVAAGKHRQTLGAVGPSAV